MIQLVSIGGQFNVHNKHYIVDATSDLSGIEDASFGDVAYCLQNNTRYIFNGLGEFVRLGDKCPPSVKGE